MCSWPAGLKLGHESNRRTLLDQLGVMGTGPLRRRASLEAHQANQPRRTVAVRRRRGKVDLKLVTGIKGDRGQFLRFSVATVTVPNPESTL